MRSTDGENAALTQHKVLSKEIIKGSVHCVDGNLTFTPEFLKEVHHCMPDNAEHFGTGEGQKNPDVRIFFIKT